MTRLGPTNGTKPLDHYLFTGLTSLVLVVEFEIAFPHDRCQRHLQWNTEKELMDDLICCGDVHFNLRGERRWKFSLTSIRSFTGGKWYVAVDLPTVFTC